MQVEIQNSERVEYQMKYGNLKDYFSSNKGKDASEITKFDSSEFDLTKLQSKLASLDAQNFEDLIINADEIANKVTHDFNVLVYGIGSKIELLERVLECLMNKYPQTYFFILKGYKPLVNMKTFLQKIIETLGSTIKNPDQIVEHIARIPKSIIIIAHSIDGKHLINEQAQKILSQLSACPNVRIVGSFDNYRYPMICKMQRVFYECVHTNKPYLSEILQIYEDQVGKQKQEEGLWYVLSSMTQKQKCIVYQFASKMLENRDGLNFSDLYDVLSDEMIVSSKQQLKENLKELSDHKIIIEKAGKYTMQYSNTILTQLAAKLEDIQQQ